jgi:hypothetical protein
MGNIFLLPIAFRLQRSERSERSAMSADEYAPSGSAQESEIAVEWMFYSEWGRKIIAPAGVLLANLTYDICQIKKIFPGLHSKNRSMIPISTADGCGMHECLVNKRTGAILGIRYNNRAEKINVLDSIFVHGIACIIADYIWPTHPPLTANFQNVSLPQHRRTREILRKISQ